MVTISGEEVELKNDTMMSSLVRLVEDVTILPQTAVFVKGRRARYACHQDGTYMCTIVEEGILKDETGVMLANSINHIRKGKSFGLRIFNNTGKSNNLDRTRIHIIT